MSRSCADDCLAVTLQTGERKGSYFDLELPLSGIVSTYFTAPQGKSKDQMMSERADKIILWMSDIYGPNFINNCLLMDWFASHGEANPASFGFERARIQTLTKAAL
jgi:hypothetical protein